MIEGSRHAAEDAILTDQPGYDRFLEILDPPAESNEGLQEILRTPWRP